MSSPSKLIAAQVAEKMAKKKRPYTRKPVVADIPKLEPLPVVSAEEMYVIDLVGMFKAKQEQELADFLTALNACTSSRTRLEYAAGRLL